MKLKKKKKSLYSNENCQSSEEAVPQNVRKTFASDTSDRGLIATIHEEPKIPKHEENKQPSQKTGHGSKQGILERRNTED